MNQAPQPNTSFIAGLDLCELFYREVVEPILRNEFPGLSYSAALIGSGSEVLGFDTVTSTDHHWGPRLMLFVNPQDLLKFKTVVVQTLSEKLPRSFRGYPTSYTATDTHDKGVQLLDYSEEGPINHRVEIMSIADFFNGYLGFDINQEIHPADWLTFPEQKLRSITAGRVFSDQVGLENMRKRFTYYPHDVWLYLLASGWTRIEQEEHLMGRAGMVGDEIGSAIIGSRLARDLMRLCFLMEKCYAPYPKWFGTAFSKLRAAGSMDPVLRQVLSARDWKQREKHLSQAYEYTAHIHNLLKITEPMPEKVSNFFDRPYLVISMGVFSKSIVAKISDPLVKEIANKRLIGSIDQFSDSTDILSEAGWRTTLRQLYENPRASVSPP